MGKKNIWKPLRIAIPQAPPPPSPAESAGPSTQYTRVRTSRDVKRAYYAKQNTRATSSGIYVLTRGRQSLSDSALPIDAGVPHSLSRASSPTPVSSAFLPSSRPSTPGDHLPSQATGWSSDYPSIPDPDAEHAHYRSTRASQWSKWTNIVLPSLIQPYLALCRRTANLASVDRAFSPPCTCNQHRTRQLKVTCVHFDSMCFTSPSNQYHSNCVQKLSRL